jgi:hypothetical protein
MTEEADLGPTGGAVWSRPDQSAEHPIENLGRDVAVVPQPVEVGPGDGFDRVARVPGDGGQRRALGQQGRGTRVATGVEHAAVLG